MATYPTYDQLADSDYTVNDGAIRRDSESGGTHIWSGYDRSQYNFVVRHFLTQSECFSYFNFYELNRYTIFDFSYDGYINPSTVYKCKFLNAPKFDWHPSGKFFVTANITGNQA